MDLGGGTREEVLDRRSLEVGFVGGPTAYLLPMFRTVPTVQANRARAHSTFPGRALAPCLLPPPSA